jgi:hypothetical protein
MFGKSTILIVLSVFTLGAWAQNTSPTPAKPADKSLAGTPSYSQGPVTPYSVAAQPSSDVLRFRRGERYNLSNSSVPELGENSEPTLLDLPETHFERAPMQFQQSDAVVVARMESGQSFLSGDKRNIYAEYRATVEDVARAGIRGLRTGDSIDVEREGGVVKLASGKTLTRGKLADSMPVVGGHYLLFLKYNPDTQDYHIQTGYQLQGGKVYRLDDQNYSEPESSHEVQHALRIEAANSDEFLSQVRTKAKKGGNQ